MSKSVYVRKLKGNLVAPGLCLLLFLGGWCRFAVVNWEGRRTSRVCSICDRLIAFSVNRTSFRRVTYPVIFQKRSRNEYLMDSIDK